MKTKEKRKLKLKAPINFPIDLQAFAKYPIYKDKRFIQITRDINMRDEHLSEEKEGEEKIPNPFQSLFRRRTKAKNKFLSSRCANWCLSFLKKIFWSQIGLFDCERKFKLNS